MIHRAARRLPPGVAILVVLPAVFCPWKTATAEARGQTVRRARAGIPARFLPLPPLPAGTARQIMNPYFAKPRWKLWALDPSPVTIDSGSFKGTFEPTPPGKRKYPIFPRGKALAIPTLKHRTKTTVAGFWDDCYMSLDNYHTRLRNPRGQFIVGGKMRNGRDVRTRFRLGVNFTSQSYAERGRHIVDDFPNNLNTERNFFFANCVRATPAHISYRDNDPEKVQDDYDCLYGHSYQSLGQSGSEVYALYKMMLAGACMPRSTKNLLKKHGAYASALLTIFKAALPYADAEGKELPYENELRHRPVYSSNGTPQHSHYCSANPYYHGYDDDLHIKNMVKLARELTAAPPVAILKLLDISVTKNGKLIVDRARRDERLKCVSLTNVRIWGGRSETLTVRIDLNGSYDLQNRPLSFTCRGVYPNQKNVSITRVGPGVFRISVKYDPKLPKGRIPVICTARNGLAVASNPVFVNFYWPGENEMDDYRPMGRLTRQVKDNLKKKLPVTVNLRPVVDLGLIGDAVRCQPGQTVSIDLKAVDPEGYPVTVFRRAGEVGQIRDGRFVFRVPPDDKPRIYKVHFIFSDGTGGYAGRRVKLLVSKKDVEKKSDSLPDGWAVTSVGQVASVATVSHDAGEFFFSDQLAAPRARQLWGCYVFRRLSGNADLMCRISRGGGAQLGLLISNGLDDFARRVGIGLFRGKVSALLKTQDRVFGGYSTLADSKLTPKPKYFRITFRDQRAAAYVSTDGGIWQQVMTGALKLRRTYCAGIVYGGRRGGVRKSAGTSCRWLTPSGPAPAMVTTGRRRPDRAGMYASPLEIRIVADGHGRTVRYTLDGSQPTARSTKYHEPIRLTRAGRHELRATTFKDGEAQNTVVAVYRLKAAAKKGPTKK